MRRSKIEMYVDILKVLAQRGPMKLTHIMYKANVNCNILKDYLDFLITQELVEERTFAKERVVFVITQRGINVLKHFRELSQDEVLILLNQGHEEIKPKISSRAVYSVQTESHAYSFKNTTSTLQLLLDKLLGEDIEIEYRRTDRKMPQLIA